MGVIIKASKVKMLDDKDRAFAETLQKLGVERSVSTIVAYLINVDKATSKEIEVGTDLRQPDVSICAKTLCNIGWLEVDKFKNEAGERSLKGRPSKIYKLKVSINEIIEYFEAERIEKYSQTLQSIQRLRQLAILS